MLYISLAPSLSLSLSRRMRGSRFINIVEITAIISSKIISRRTSWERTSRRNRALRSRDRLLRAISSREIRRANTRRLDRCMQGTKRVARYIKPSCGIFKRIRRGSAEQPIVGFFSFLNLKKIKRLAITVTNFIGLFFSTSFQHRYSTQYRFCRFLPKRAPQT